MSNKIGYYKKEYDWGKSSEILVFLDFELYDNFYRYIDILLQHKSKILAGNINKGSSLQPQVVMNLSDYQKMEVEWSKHLEPNEFLTVFIVTYYKDVPTKSEIDLGPAVEHYSTYHSGMFWTP